MRGSIGRQAVIAVSRPFCSCLLKALFRRHGFEGETVGSVARVEIYGVVDIRFQQICRKHDFDDRARICRDRLKRTCGHERLIVSEGPQFNLVAALGRGFGKRKFKTDSRRVTSQRNLRNGGIPGPSDSLVILSQHIGNDGPGGLGRQLLLFAPRLFKLLFEQLGPVGIEGACGAPPEESQCKRCGGV